MSQTAGFWSIKSYSSWEPRAKFPMIFPRWRVFFLPLTTPASANLAMLLVIISV